MKHDGTLVAHQVAVPRQLRRLRRLQAPRHHRRRQPGAGPYRIPNTRIESLHVYTNTVPGGHMRAPGEPQGIFALESHLDEIARALGMDPVDLRMKNLVEDGDETAFGERLHDVRAKRRSGRRPKPPATTTPRRRTSAAASPSATAAPAAASAPPRSPCSADGTVLLGHAGLRPGHRHYTTLRQVVAEELGIDAAARSTSRSGARQRARRVRLRHRRQPRHPREHARRLRGRAEPQGGAAANSPREQLEWPRGRARPTTADASHAAAPARA